MSRFVANIQILKDRYTSNTVGYTPKIIIETGSQFHTPPGNGEWGTQPNGPLPSCQSAGNEYRWGCLNKNAIWIESFWNYFSAHYPEYADDIGGFGVHYYQLDDPNCADNSTCYLGTSKVLSTAQSLKDWANAKGLPTKEIWITETSTWISPQHCSFPENGQTIVAQQNGFQCRGVSYFARDYITKLQDALAQQGIVNRWAWFADRHGDYNKCSTNNADGDSGSLNSSCSALSLSPYGTAFKELAPYR